MGPKQLSELSVRQAVEATKVATGARCGPDMNCSCGAGGSPGSHIYCSAVHLRQTSMHISMHLASGGVAMQWCGRCTLAMCKDPVV